MTTILFRIQVDCTYYEIPKHPKTFQRTKQMSATMLNSTNFVLSSLKQKKGRALKEIIWILANNCTICANY